MKQSNTFTQYSIITDHDLQAFQDKLNAELRNLKDKEPEVNITSCETMRIAEIRYTEDAIIKEPDPAEKGVRFTCEECPMFKPAPKRDGTPDLRSKYGDCPHSEMQRTWKTAPACGVLYTMIKNGSIRLVLNPEPIILGPNRLLTPEEFEDLERKMNGGKK